MIRHRLTNHVVKKRGWTNEEVLVLGTGRRPIDPLCHQIGLPIFTAETIGMLCQIMTKNSLVFTPIMVMRGVPNHLPYFPKLRRFGEKLENYFQARECNRQYDGVILSMKLLMTSPFLEVHKHYAEIIVVGALQVWRGKVLVVANQHHGGRCF